jgi:CubicO group peptidase (beta-lactamase class C family)
LTLNINRRQLLGNGLKAAVGIAVMHTVTEARPVLLAEHIFSQADPFAPTFKRLDEFIVRHMTEVGAPGMTVALANRNGLLRSSQYGFADVKSGVQVAPQTLFEIGSISKSFVAMAILQQAEEGKLDLHKPVVEYLPWLKVDSRFPPFTTHHLLSHTAGLSGVPLLMRVAATTLRTAAAPGTQFVYSNIGYDLLGFILEAVDKKPFAEIMRRRVLQRLGMTSSSPIISNEIREQMALGYWPLKPDRPFPLRGKLGEAPWVEVPEAAGSIAAPAADMGNYLRMLMNRGAGASGRVLAEKTFASFIKPVIKAPFRGEDASYAYGLWVSDVNGHTLLRHTGGMVAFSSAMYADITEGVAAFASVNARLAGGYRPVAVTKYALELMSAAVRGQELPPLPPPLPSPATIKNAADYAGTYTSPDGKKLVLTSSAEQLILQHGNARIVLEQAGRDRFLVKHPDFELFALSFGRDKDKVVEAFHGENWWMGQGYSGPKSFEYPKEWVGYTGHFHSDNLWYGSMRVVIRKGQLMIDGEQPLVPVDASTFRPAGDSDVDRLVFDVPINGQATRLNYSGIEFFRTFTP